MYPVYWHYWGRFDHHHDDHYDKNNGDIENNDDVEDNNDLEDNDVGDNNTINNDIKMI